ncbi:hemagglutinin, partial [Neisseria meningitidis]|nr:hemagglutinin [Neisseria meningitidis]
YFAEKPTPYLVNEHGFYMDKNGDLIKDNSGNPIKMTEENKLEYSTKVPNPYLDDFEQKWIKGQTHNKVSGDNPSLPVPVRTKKQQGER